MSFLSHTARHLQSCFVSGTKQLTFSRSARISRRNSQIALGFAWA